MLDWFELGFKPEIELEESLDEETSDVASFSLLELFVLDTDSKFRTDLDGLITEESILAVADTHFNLISGPRIFDIVVSVTEVVDVQLVAFTSFLMSFEIFGGIVACKSKCGNTCRWNIFPCITCIEDIRGRDMTT